MNDAKGHCFEPIKMSDIGLESNIVSFTYPRVGIHEARSNVPQLVGH